jgi:urocanate hydratase
MGGAQPLAITMNDGVCIAVEVDRDIIKRKVERGWVDIMTESPEEALKNANEAIMEGNPLGIGLLGNAAEIFQWFVKKGVTPDIITDMTPAHDPLLYVPMGLNVEEAKKLRESDPELYIKLAAESARKQVEAMLEFKRRGAVVFEYGNDLRRLAHRGGLELKKAFEIKSFVVEFIRSLLCRGRGPFRWVSLSGNKEDIYKIDELVIKEFSGDDMLVRWIKQCHKIPFEGLPARVCWLGYGQRARFAKKVNKLVSKGELEGPVAFSRDCFDSGSVTQPYMETESMKDGSDPIADWPLLNALLNTAAGADLVAIQGGGGLLSFVASGVIVIADGTKETEERLERVLTTDPGIGVIRHAEAGYEEAKEFAKKERVGGH